MQSKNKVFSSALSRFYFSIVMVILTGILLSLWLAGNPVWDALGSTLRADFAHEGELVNLAVSRYVDRCVENSKFMASQTLPKRVIRQYLSGQISYSELVHFNELGFSDSVSMLANAESAIRVVDQKVVFHYGQERSLPDFQSSPPGLDVEFILAENLLQVTTPIIDREGLLGYDVIWFDISNVLTEIDQETIKYTLVSGLSNSTANPSGLPGAFAVNPDEFTVATSSISGTNYFLHAQIKNSELYAPFYQVLNQLVWALVSFALVVLFLTQSLVIKTAKKLIGELQLMSQKYKYLATRDSLSGVYSRHHFNEWLSKIDSASSDQELSLIMIDVDNLKSVNDSFGHLAGDTVIEAVGRALLDNFRKNDLVFRYGGDEFVIAAAASKAECEMAAKRALAALTKAGPNNTPISFSYGVIHFDSQDATILLNKADAMMYEMKEAQKSQLAE